MSGAVVIKDGRGSGQGALVDDHGRLFTRANVISHMSHHATFHKNGYIQLFETTLPGATRTHCMFIENTDPEKDLEVHWIRVSVDAAVEIIIAHGHEYTSGGSSVTLRNSNVGQPAAVTGNFYEGGASGDLTLNTAHDRVIDGAFMAANSREVFDYDGGLVLPNTKGLTVSAIGANTNKIKVMLGFALHEAGTQL